MVLCSQCRTSTLEASTHWQVRPCAIREGEPCLACKKDMDLELKIQELQERRRKLRTRMNTNHDSFVLKLPPEIAAHILFLSMNEQDLDPDHLTTLPTQFLLGAVCRGWRQLARSTPQLWSTLSFSLAKRTKMEALQQLRAVKDWLQLSGSLPLILGIFCYERITLASQERCGLIIEALNQHSGRWHKVLLQLPAPLFSRFCGTSPPSRLCNLQLVNYSSSDVVSPPFRMNSKPSPTHLVIERFGLLAIDIVWDNLTYLVLDVAFDGWIEAIRRAPFLEFLSVAQPRNTDSFSIPNTIVRHMHLRTLKFCDSVEFSIRFNDVMEFPSLEEYHWNSCRPIPANSITSLLNRSGSHLKRLELFMEDPPTWVDLKELLDATPYLQHFRMSIWAPTSAVITDDLLQNLSSSPPVLAGGNPGFLPHLQSLWLSPQFLDESTWESIPQIFGWPHRKHLRLKVHIGVKMGMNVGITDQVSQLIGQGANIDIRHSINLEDFLPQFKGTGA